MIRRIFLFAVAFLPALLSAQPLEKALLWKISGKGLEKPSYLYGTIHASCDLTLEPGTENALSQTAQLYLELDLDDPQMGATLMYGMNMQGGKKMQQLVSAEDFAIADAYVQKELGISLLMMATVKPSLVSAMLIPKYLDCEATSMEGVLMEKAKARGEDVFGLETFQEQLAVFDEIPYEEQMKDLVAAAKADPAADRKEFDELNALYRAKDIDALQKAASATDAVASKYENMLLGKRNSNWIPRITRIAAEKPTFFAVGAAHLGGPDGVIRQLQKAGYTVVPVH
jgi:uncharacterized protein